MIFKFGDTAAKTATVTDFDDVVAHKKDVNTRRLELSITMSRLRILRERPSDCLTVEVTIFQFLENFPSFVGGKHFRMTSGTAFYPQIQDASARINDYFDIIEAVALRIEAVTFEFTQVVAFKTKEMLADDETLGGFLFAFVDGKGSAC